ncbi:MAG: carbohydrate kinase family protein [Chloroflexota bacterium]
MSQVLVCGAINWDTTCFVPHLPSPGEEVTCTRVSEVSGGTGENVAVAAARFLGPDKVALVGALGTDAIARRQIEALKDEGVSTSGVAKVRSHVSGHAYIFVDESGQNVISSNLGANTALAPRHVTRRKLQSLASHCRCIVLTDPPLAVASALIQYGASRRIPVLWDPGVLVDYGWNALRALLPGVDSLVLNEAEAERLFGKTRVEEIRHLLENEGPAYLVLKRGALGSVAISVQGKNAVHSPPLPLRELGLKTVSAVGCGDVFIGTYGACLSEGMSREASLLMASAASGYNVTRPETRGAPDRETLDRLMDKAAGPGFETQGVEYTDE